MAVPSRVGAPRDPRRGFGEGIHARAAQDGPRHVSQLLLVLTCCVAGQLLIFVGLQLFNMLLKSVHSICLIHTGMYVFVLNKGFFLRGGGAKLRPTFTFVYFLLIETVGTTHCARPIACAPCRLIPPPPACPLSSAGFLLKLGRLNDQRPMYRPVGNPPPPRKHTRHPPPPPNSDAVSCGYSGVVFAWMVVLSLKPDAVRKEKRGGGVLRCGQG